MSWDRPRWLTVRDLAAAAGVTHAAYGGSYLRHLVKVTCVPHLTCAGHAAVLGVGPDHGHRDARWRVLDSVTHAVWMVVVAARSSGGLPWVLRPAYATGWTLFNLASGPAKGRAVLAALAVAGHAIGLADRYGMDILARADADHPRLLAAYLRRGGFRIVATNGRTVSLRRTAVDREPAGTGREWRKVLRTGRTTLPTWQARFGVPRGPFLDLGAGDSPLAAQLAAVGVAAVSVDPSYALHPPRGHRGAVAGLAERLPFQAGTFATVHANFVLQHVERPRRALAECVRVARADGRLILHPVWAHRPLRARLARLPGVQFIAGHALPPRRHRPSLILTPAEFDLDADGAQVVSALRPMPIIMWLGRLAMRAAVSVQGRQGPVR